MCYSSYVKSSVSCLTAQINRGYIAPEYVIHGQLSEKVDTYSFGIVVLKIISGRRGANLKKEPAGSSSLLEHTWNLFDRGAHLDLVDKKIALMCTQSPSSARPTMSHRPFHVPSLNI
ncbi:hypothetical protein DCAR_0933753 [Daucus carota subsp. sativus]|uniref:Protein kinase domain-containing protein n=1 Tax=Daucus carota subsp. sativus TaxID=79200 RepID=A0AAF0XXE2_DAUCS|nr:hypothetical protein DCAR_0933753 [Daucus carota subsp. sativus]